jgi:Transposase
MPKKRFSSEHIIAKLRQIEVQLAQGKSIALACKDAAISEQSYFRWRKEYGGVPLEQAKPGTKGSNAEQTFPTCHAQPREPVCVIPVTIYGTTSPLWQRE